MAINLEDSYVPNLFPYFTSSGKMLENVNISVECGICGTGLAITQPADKDHETFAMLPCGHIFGYHCIKSWFKQMANCPHCRKAMAHRICGHDTPLKEMHGGPGFNIRRDLPLVVGQLELPGLCTGCQPSLSEVDENDNNTQFDICEYLSYNRPGAGNPALRPVNFIPSGPHSYRDVQIRLEEWPRETLPHPQSTANNRLLSHPAEFDLLSWLAYGDEWSVESVPPTPVRQ